MNHNTQIDSNCWFRLCKRWTKSGISSHFATPSEIHRDDGMNWIELIMTESIRHNLDRFLFLSLDYSPRWSLMILSPQGQLISAITSFLIQYMLFDLISFIFVLSTPFHYNRWTLRFCFHTFVRCQNNWPSSITIVCLFFSNYPLDWQYRYDCDNCVRSCPSIWLSYN